MTKSSKTVSKNIKSSIVSSDFEDDDDDNNNHILSKTNLFSNSKSGKIY